MSKKKSKWETYKTSVILIIFCVIGAILGLVLGPSISNIVRPIGNIFLNLLFCTIVPLIFFSIAGSIANTNDTRKVGKTLIISLVFFIATATLASLITMGVTSLVGVPTNFQVDMETTEAAKTSLADQIVGTFTVGDFPDLISRYHVLPLIIMTVFFGICCSFVGKEAEPMKQFLNSGSAIMYKMVSELMKLAPIGLGAYFADLTATYGIEILKTYGFAMLTFYGIVFAYFFIFLGIYAYIGAGSWGVKHYFKSILPAALTALGTRSSAATIPLQMDACKTLGVPDDIYSVVIPLGATCHMDGACIAMTYCIVLATTMFGMPLKASQIALAVFVAVASSVATSSVPGGGAAGETMIISVFGLPDAAMPILLMIIELFDPGCTLLNSCGDTVVSMVASRFVYGKDWYKHTTESLEKVEG